MGIIIGLIYSLFTLINGQMYLFTKENNEILEYNLFNSTLKRDIEQSVSYDFNSETLRLGYYNQDTIRYHFKSKHIIRENRIKKDTFKIDLISSVVKNIDLINSENQNIEIKLRVLKSTISANYILSRSISETINNTEFNED